MLLLVTGIVSEIENLKILNYLINIINAVLFNLLDIYQFSGSYWVWQSDIGKGRFMKNESTFCNFWGSFVSSGGMIFFSVFQLTIMEIPGMCSLNDEAVLSQLQIKITPWIYAAKRASTPFFRRQRKEAWIVYRTMLVQRLSDSRHLRKVLYAKTTTHELSQNFTF